MGRAGNLLLLLASLVVALLGAELAVRALTARTAVVLPSGERKTRFNPYRPDASLSYALRADWSGLHRGADFRVPVRLNALGMRGARPSRAKPPGALRVLVVGDSFAFGWGVADAESFPARLAQRWNASGHRVEVLDAAVPGYSADHHWIYLRETGFALAPDLLLLALCHNDPDDLAWSRLTLGPDRLPVRTRSLRRFIAEDGRMHYLNEERNPLPSAWLTAAGAFGERSLLLTYLRYNALRFWLAALENRTLRRQEVDAGPPPSGPIASLAPDEIERGLQSGLAFQLRYHAFLVDAIQREAEARGIRVATVVTGDGPGPLGESCRSDQDCLDLGAALDRAAHRDLYLPVDGHWSARGHRRAAEAIDAWLAARGWPPPATR